MLTLATLLILAQFGERPRLQPYEVESASGEWTLEVRPTDPEGEGPMGAKILHGGRTSWSGEFPWTFQQAAIADDGTCVGYANGDELRIAVLEPTGSLRRQHVVQPTAFPVHGPNLPSAVGPVLVHPSADLAWIRVLPADQSRPAPWRSFRLSTGEEIGDVMPEPPVDVTEDQGIYEGDARVIGDTGLTLLHWWYSDRRPKDLGWSEDGGVFAIHDQDGKAVWKLELLDDYTDRSSRKADDGLFWEARNRGHLVSVGPDNTFFLHHVRDGLRVGYEVERDAGSGRWLVRERSREPWDESAHADEIGERIDLELDRRITLRPEAPPQHPIRDVMVLGFTEEGELELIRSEADGGTSYVRLRTDGSVLFERDLAALLPEGRGGFHELQGDRWLFHRAEVPAWIEFDVRTGETAVAPLPESLGSHIAPLADGGYVALLDRKRGSASIKELYRVLADGTIGWQEDLTAFGGGGLARTGETSVTILSSRELKRIDTLDRSVLGVLRLRDVLGRPGGYVTGLLSDPEGGVLFRDNGVFQRIDASGKHAGSFVPRRSDGTRNLSMDGLLRVSPDGRLWTSDRHNVYRLDEEGVADLVLGPEPRNDLLRSADHGAIDVLGRALVQDSASGSAHVFDAEGRKLAVCRLPSSERPLEPGVSPIGGELDGSVWIRTGDGRATFDATGTRLEASREREDEEEATRKAALVETIETRPGGTWLVRAQQRGVLQDGRLVIVEGADLPASPAEVHLYSAEGEPLHSVRIPGERWISQLCVGPHWVVVGSYGPSWALLRLEDEHVFLFEPDLGPRTSWRVGQTPDGRTLLLLDPRELELVRYELP